MKAFCWDDIDDVGVETDDFGREDNGEMEGVGATV